MKDHPKEAKTRRNNQDCSTETSRLRKKYRSTTHYILSSLIPYTESNLALAFKPNLFFDQLEILSNTKQQRKTLASSYYRAIKSGLIEINDSGAPILTPDGKAKLQRYEPTKLPAPASILVIYDIPESERAKRSQLRLTLRELRFVQVQQSVWESKYDIINYLLPQIEELDLEDYIQIYESAKIY